MSVPRQLALDLPHRPAMSREDFLVGASNANAVAAIDAWPAWPGGEMVLSGPAGSGKSHLAAVWQARSAAHVLSAASLATADWRIVSSAVVIEDCGSGLDETALFHLLNRLHRVGGHVLLTARAQPVSWKLQLPDLVSRLRRMPVAQLDPPDDALMQAVLVKLFADRQIEVEASVVRFLVMRLERSFSAMHAAVDRLDRLAIEEKRRVTRALAARSLQPI